MDIVKKMYTQLEVARILGEPKDPRRPFTKLVGSVCETDSADSDEYVYYFDTLLDTDKVVITTSSGEVQQESVSPDTPTELTFVDVSTPEYYIKLNDLTKAKESTLARKTTTINRALNEYENYKVVELLASAASSSGNENTLTSGQTTFSYNDLVAMIDQVVDYGDKYTLVSSAQIETDIRLWNWNDNKYHNLLDALADLNLTRVRVGTPQKFTNYPTPGGSGTVTQVLGTNLCYLVAEDTEMGKPLLFVRKKLDSIAMLGGVLSDKGEGPERLIFSSPNPVTVVSTSKRYLAIGLTGYEEIATAVKNVYAVSKFTRT